jgi:hypothetical protein
MATLPGQRATFTWALNEFNKSDDPNKKLHFIQLMAKIISDAPKNGFTVEQVTQDQSYPIEVEQYVNSVNLEVSAEVSEEQAAKKIIEAVEASDVTNVGQGTATVYAYGYACCPDRLKVGSTEKDIIQRIAQQIGTSTPDKPILYLAIKTDECRALERAIQSVLQVRGRKIKGGGDEWFKVNREELLSIYTFIISSGPNWA